MIAYLENSIVPSQNSRSVNVGTRMEKYEQFGIICKIIQSFLFAKVMYVIILR